MSEINNIFIIDPDNTASWADKYNYRVGHVSIEDLYAKDERFVDAIVFIDNNPAYCGKIKEILPINPGINFILYYKNTISPSQLVEFVKSGVIESVSLDDDEQIKLLIEQYGSESSDSQLSYYNNLIRKFKDFGIITNSLKMAEVFAKVEKIANTNSTVLIYGENGTGKELIARSIHHFSPRREYRYVGTT